MLSAASFIHSGLEEAVGALYKALCGEEPMQELKERLRNDLIAGRTLFQVVNEISSNVSRIPRSSQAQVREAIIELYGAALARVPSSPEVEIWANALSSGQINEAELVTNICTSQEATARKKRTHLRPEMTDGTFIQAAYETALNRGALPNEIAHWQVRLSTGEMNRQTLLLNLFDARLSECESASAEITETGATTYVLGRAQSVTKVDWEASRLATKQHAAPGYTKFQSSRRSPGEKNILVSCIASLYRGGRFIESFLENVTTQTIFDHCELVIIDACSPEGELDVINRFRERFPNIVYYRTPTRVGIYEAWNMAISLSSGTYITNTNLDDLRRADSLETQSSALDALPYVDVVYQDFYYTFDRDLCFEDIAAAGITSDLPPVSAYSLLQFNSPHNAPMWRRAIHTQVGEFDTSFKSAGDYDFWLRCAMRGKNFFKTNDPHVAYFVNPEGLSTRRDTRGVEESQRITRRYARLIVDPSLTCSAAEFLRQLPENTAITEGAEMQSESWRYDAVQGALRAITQSGKTGYSREGT